MKDKRIEKAIRCRLGRWKCHEYADLDKQFKVTLIED